MEDTIPTSRLAQAVAHIAASSYPVLTLNGWCFASADAFRLFWELQPFAMIATETGTVLCSVAKEWLPLHNFTLPQFEAALLELDDLDVIDVWEAPGVYVDGSPCHAYHIAFLVLSRMCAPQRAAKRSREDDGTFTRHSALRIARLVEKFGATCVYCKCSGTDECGPDGRRWHRDHVWAKSHGGPSGSANIVLACATCNIRKHQLSAEDFLAKLTAHG